MMKYNIFTVINRVKPLLSVTNRVKPWLMLMLLTATTAVAQNTHKLHLVVKPDYVFTVQLNCYETAATDGRGNFTSPSISSQTGGENALYVDMTADVPAGGGIWMQIQGTSSSAYPFQYKLLGWTANGQPVELSEKMSGYRAYYMWEMPDEDVELVGRFEFDPTTYPGENTQPGTGSWDPETGTLICDYNGQMPLGFNTSTDGPMVQTLIEAGDNYGNNNNISFNASAFPNCSTWDMSRTNAKSVRAQRTALKTVILPSTITALSGSYVFQGTALETLVLYATTPPTLNSNKPFPDSPNLMVRVPAEAVPLYKAAPGWKDLNIVAMDEDYVNLHVQLMATPQAATLAQYKNMSLVLTNKSSGQTRRFIVNGLLNDYEYHYLTTKTIYKVQLLNDRDIEVATLDDIYLGEDSRTVAMPQLRGVHDLQLLLTVNGERVGDGMYNNIWTTNTGEYIARGITLPGVLDGEQLRYSISLDQSLAMQYATPAVTDLTVGQQADDIILALQPLEEKEVSFLVYDSLTHRGIADATITVAQLFGQGERGTTVTLTTGGDGRVTGKLLAVPSAVTVNSPMHGSQSVAVDLSTTPSVTMAFLQATGTTIQLSHTWQAAVEEGQEPKVQNGYDSGRSLDYTFTATLPDGRDSVITRYLVSYPLYTLYSDLPKGTKVRVQAVSATGAIEPVTAEATVGEGKTVQVLLPIVERGYIRASYIRTESSKPAVLVFNAAGELVRRMPFYDKESKTTNIVNLPVGNYYVAAMSQGIQYAGISSRAQLEMYVADKDYVAQDVSVSDGHIAKASFISVPLTTTQLETNLTERRAHWASSDITVGYTTSIVANVAFKGLKERMWGTNYDESLYPTDCRLEVYMPEGLPQPVAWRSYRQYTWGIKTGGWFDSEYHTTMVSHGTKQDVEKLTGDFRIMSSEICMTQANSQWFPDERKLIVQWPHIDEGGKMQIVITPTLSNRYMPEVYLCYTLNGMAYREILETNVLTVSRSSIKVPELVINPTFTVSGKAMYYEETSEAAGSRMNAASSAAAVEHNLPVPNHEQYVYYEVTVMDGNDEIGRAKINSSGEWKATCTLARATSLSTHEIYAKIAYRNGISYQTEAKKLTYDPNGVVPYTVKMSFFNHHPDHLINQEVLFNLVTQEATPTSYGYSNEEGYKTDFTFEINLSNNDSTKVYAVDLAIFTEGPDAESFIIPAHYNKRKNRWIAYHKFNTRSLPCNVNVRPYYHGDAIGSASELQEVYDNFANWFQRDEDSEKLADELLAYAAQIQRALDANDESLLPDPNDILALLDKMGDSSIDTGLGNEIDAAQADAIMAQLEATAQEMQGWEELFGNGVPNLNTLGNSLEGITFSTAEGMTPESLKANGFDEMLLDDGSKIYTKVEEGNIFTFVDLANNLLMRTDGSKLNATRGVPRREGLMDYVNDVLDKVDELKGLVDKINTGASALSDMFKLMINSNNAAIETAKAAIKCDLRDKVWPFWSNTIVRNAGNLAKLQKETGILKMAKSAIDHFKLGDKMGRLASLYGLVRDAMKAISDLKRLIQIKNALPDPCPDDYINCNALSQDLVGAIIITSTYQATVIANDVAGLAVAFASVLGISSGALAPAGLLGIACSLVQFGLSYTASKIYDKKTEYMTNEFAYRKSQLKCHKKEKGDGDDGDEECNGECGDSGDGGGGGDGGGMGGGTSGTTGILDPSGFVYEGVESNRLEGVTATVFYKETVKDMFGEEQEKISLWDAERYNQINPQITDINGEYGWMVPTGLWQVKYEKRGYQTEYSEWLPVPPPQLDVNQPMTSIAQPVVSDVKATTQAVTVTFDKYMLADSLTDARLFVTRNGQKVSGTLDKPLPTDEAEALKRLTNRVRFVPTTALPAGQKLTLTVKGDVQSYASVEMGSDFSQEFDIKANVEKIVADTAINVVYDEGTALTIQAQPAEAAAGKKVKARILSDMIASINQNQNENQNFVEVTLDSQGKATIVITGEAHGTTALILEMADDADIQTVVTVTVREQGDFVCPMPVSDYQPSQAYPAGTQISLSCSLPGATILYTTDGSCPCSDGNNVITYTGPITLMADMVIKAIARAPGYEDSDIAELTFMVEGSGPDTPVTYQLVVADAGYATFYDSQRAYQMPAGLTASTVSGISGGRLNYQQLSGSIIPQATAVLIEAQQKQAATYTLTSTVADGSAVSNNLLHGSDYATTTDAGQEDAGGYLFYKLAYGPSNTSLANSFGWFWGAQQGAPFSIEGHRAWLAVPKQAGARAYLINGESADIQYVELPQQQSGQVTDLQGRRLDKPTQPGIYIKDGRKVVVGGLRPK